MVRSVQKTCCICGLDLSGTKRVRDPRGKYYCNPCYHARLEEYQRRRLAEQQMEASGTQLLADADAAEQRRCAQTAVSVADGARVAVQAEQVDCATGARACESAHRSGWAGIMAWLGGRNSAELDQHVDVSDAIANGFADQPPHRDQYSPVQHVEVHRRIARRAARRVVRVSDLLGPDALAEVEAARENPRAAEPEIPASPIVNPPVSTILAEYAQEQGAFDEDMMRAGRVMG